MDDARLGRRKGKLDHATAESYRVSDENDNDIDRGLEQMIGAKNGDWRKSQAEECRPSASVAEVADRVFPLVKHSEKRSRSVASCLMLLSKVG